MQDKPTWRHNDIDAYEHMRSLSRRAVASTLHLSKDPASAVARGREIHAATLGVNGFTRENVDEHTIRLHKHLEAVR